MSSIEALPENEFNSKFLYSEEPTKFTGKDVDKFLIYCFNIGASDISIQSQEQVVCEIHGKMYRVTRHRLAKNEVAEIITAIYGSESGIGILNKGEDLDTSYEIKPDRESRLRYRVNVSAISTYGHTGYAITLRTITGMPPHIDTMKLPTEILENIAPKQGMVLITGATGSGKSTLLAAVIRSLCEDPDGHRKILTYESPIEFVYDDVIKPTTIVSQSEIPKHLPNFADAIRNALRRKPSIILVGEMRDKETIGEGVTASMTGHLVYSTLHSNGFADTVRRMVNVFPNEEKHARAVDILSSTKMTISQMLLPSTDGKRVPIREYVIFNDDIVDELLDAGVDNLTTTSRRVLKKHGHSFLQDAQQRYEEGLLDINWFNKIRRLSKGSDEDTKI